MFFCVNLFRLIGSAPSALPDRRCVSAPRTSAHLFRVFFTKATKRFNFYLQQATCLDSCSSRHPLELPTDVIYGSLTFSWDLETLPHLSTSSAVNACHMDFRSSSRRVMAGKVISPFVFMFFAPFSSLAARPTCPPSALALNRLRRAQRHMTRRLRAGRKDGREAAAPLSEGKTRITGGGLQQVNVWPALEVKTSHNSSTEQTLKNKVCSLSYILSLYCCEDLSCRFKGWNFYCFVYCIQFGEKRQELKDGGPEASRSEEQHFQSQSR